MWTPPRTWFHSRSPWYSTSRVTTVRTIDGSLCSLTLKTFSVPTSSYKDLSSDSVRSGTCYRSVKCCEVRQKNDLSRHSAGFEMIGIEHTDLWYWHVMVWITLPWGELEYLCVRTWRSEQVDVKDNPLVTWPLRKHYVWKNFGSTMCGKIVCRREHLGGDQKNENLFLGSGFGTRIENVWTCWSQM